MNSGTSSSYSSYKCIGLQFKVHTQSNSFLSAFKILYNYDHPTFILYRQWNEITSVVFAKFKLEVFFEELQSISIIANYLCRDSGERVLVT